MYIYIYIYLHMTGHRAPLPPRSHAVPQRTSGGLRYMVKYINTYIYIYKKHLYIYIYIYMYICIYIYMQIDVYV